MFGSDCCTFIPNNTAPDGSFTRAMKKIKELRQEVATNAGREKSLGYWFVSVFGSWKEWRVQMGIIIAVTVGVVPFLRSRGLDETVRIKGVLSLLI